MRRAPPRRADNQQAPTADRRQHTLCSEPPQPDAAAQIRAQRRRHRRSFTRAPSFITQACLAPAHDGYVSGAITDPDDDNDIYTMWKKVQDNAFALRTVALLHLWAAAGKPGGNNPPAGETVLRSMSLDYVENEIFEILRRYQGWGDEPVEHAKMRLALYHLFEKYDGISRNG